MKKQGKKQAEERIKEFFRNLENQKPGDSRKIKRLAMSHNIKLKELRKKFCRKCYSAFNAKNSQTRIKNGFKRVKCLNCSYASGWRMK